MKKPGFLTGTATQDSIRPHCSKQHIPDYGYQKSSSRTQNPNHVLFGLSRFSNELISPSHSSSSALCFAFYMRPLSTSMHSCKIAFLDEYLFVPTSPSSLSSLFTTWFTIGFHKFRFFFSFSISSPGIWTSPVQTFSATAALKIILAAQT